MHAQRAPASFREHREISTRLRGLYNSEGVFLIGDLKVVGGIRSDLQKDTAVRTTLVGLSCRVQESRTKSKNRRYLLRIPDHMANVLQCTFVGVVHRDVAEQRKIVTCARSS